MVVTSHTIISKLGIRVMIFEVKKSHPSGPMAWFRFTAGQHTYPAMLRGSGAFGFMSKFVKEVGLVEVLRNTSTKHCNVLRSLFFGCSFPQHHHFKLGICVVIFEVKKSHPSGLIAKWFRFTAGQHTYPAMLRGSGAFGFMSKFVKEVGLVEVLRNTSTKHGNVLRSVFFGCFLGNFVCELFRSMRRSGPWRRWTQWNSMGFQACSS